MSKTIAYKDGRALDDIRIRHVHLNSKESAGRETTHRCLREVNVQRWQPFLSAAVDQLFWLRQQNLDYLAFNKNSAATRRPALSMVLSSTENCNRCEWHKIQNSSVHAQEQSLMTTLNSEKKENSRFGKTEIGIRRIRQAKQT